MFTNPETVTDNHIEVKNLESRDCELELKNNSINESNELPKKITVVTNNLSISFISVPNSDIVAINLELENAGINEKHDKNKAVAIEENDKHAPIMSL